MEPVRFSFLLRSVYSKPNWWKLAEDPACPMCGKVGTLDPILTSCLVHVVISQGRFGWHRDRVFRQIYHHIDIERNKSVRPLVKEGQSCKSEANKVGVLLTAMGYEGWPEEETAVPRRRANQPTPRYGPLVNTCLEVGSCDESHGRRDVTRYMKERLTKYMKERLTKYVGLKGRNVWCSIEPSCWCW